jgi:DNA helicase II / ATP-dependent DNA helicase PcrA
MTRRIAYLIEVEGMQPEAILGVTFTRAAARELRQRLEDLLGVAIADRIAIFTLHAFALRQLLRNRGAPNLPRPIRIADDFDERRVIQEELKVLTGARRIKDIQTELQNLASDWETLAADDDEWEQRHPNPRFLGAWRRHREIYGYTLRAELVYGVKKALEQDPEFEIERDFEHVVVDEYQDLNHCEIEVVRELEARGPDLFAAGDDDQSIYGFRNAYPLGLRDFQQTYAGSTSEELEVCHRCDVAILRVGLDVAEQDVDRIPKELHAREDADEGVVDVRQFRNISHEATGIAEICRELIEDHEVDPEKILILLRNDPQSVYSGPLIDALEDAGFNAEMPEDPFKILDEPENRVIVCLLRLLREPRDGLAWRELLELRDNRIGAATLMEAYRLADETGEGYVETLHAIAANPELLPSRTRNRFAGEVAAIDGLLADLDGLFDEELEDGLDRLLQQAGLDPDESENVAEARTLLLSLLPEDSEPTVGTLEETLQSAQGSYNEAEERRRNDRIRIMTMHSAKGLTADAVIVAACEDELIPGQANDRRELDDQRRLLYVSLTRAKHFLFVTYAGRRAGRQSQMLQVPEERHLTRFLQDFVQPVRIE